MLLFLQMFTDKDTDCSRETEHHTASIGGGEGRGDASALPPNGDTKCLSGPEGERFSMGWFVF